MVKAMSRSFKLKLKRKLGLPPSEFYQLLSGANPGAIYEVAGNWSVGWSIEWRNMVPLKTEEGPALSWPEEFLEELF